MPAIGSDYQLVSASDFIQYWSAIRVLIAGGNPYDPSAMLQIQHHVSPTGVIPIMCWNPPWVLLFLLPVLVLPFWQAEIGWQILSVLALCALGLHIGRLYQRAHQPLFTALGLVTFFPLVSNFQFCQLGVVLLAGVVLLWQGLREDRAARGALGVALLSVKLHLFVPLLGVVFLDAVRRRRFSLPLLSAGLVTALALSCELLVPGILSAWLKAIISQPVGAIATRSWKVPTLVGLVRSAIYPHDGGWALATMFFIPLGAVLALTVYLLPRRENVDWARALPWILLVSYICSPYGWLYDQLVLLPMHFMVLGAAVSLVVAGCRRAGWQLLLLAGTVQLFALTDPWNVMPAQHHYFWLPLALGAVGWRAETLLKTIPRTGTARGSDNINAADSGVPIT